MSVRVNLLPGDVRARGRAGRSRAIAGVIAVVVLLVLGGLTFLQRGEIQDAEDRLAAAQATTADLAAQVSALQPFADLENRASGAVDTVVVALGPEKSYASMLQDLSAVMPPNAELQTISIVTQDEPLAPSAGGDRLVYGRLAANGRVLDGVAPGIERLVIDLERVAAFDNVYVTTSAVDENGVATFTLEIELGPEVITGRYSTLDEEAAS